MLLYTCACCAYHLDESSFMNKLYDSASGNQSARKKSFLYFITSYFFSLTLLLFCSAGYAAQQIEEENEELNATFEPRDVNLRWSGFVRLNSFMDSRQIAAESIGDMLFFPLPVVKDPF